MTWRGTGYIPLACAQLVLLQIIRSNFLVTAATLRNVQKPDFTRAGNYRKWTA
jgi:hypothetical protein